MRWDGRDFGRIIQKSRTPRHHFINSAIQTLIAAKDWPKEINFHSLQGSVNGARNSVSLFAITIGRRVFWRVDGLPAISVGSF